MKRKPDLRQKTVTTLAAKVLKKITLAEIKKLYKQSNQKKEKNHD